MADHKILNEVAGDIRDASEEVRGIALSIEIGGKYRNIDNATRDALSNIVGLLDTAIENLNHALDTLDRVKKK